MARCRAEHAELRRRHEQDSARWAAQDAAKQLAAEERDVALREVSTMAQELEALQVALGSPSPTRRRE